jgi:hypothetical protein
MTKQICANCHFFIRQYRDERGAEHTFAVGAEQRARAISGDLSWQRESESLGCSRGVWDEGLGIGEAGKTAAISQQNRRGKCYFFMFQPGMLLPAAEKLQHERASTSKERLKYRLTIYGLLVGLIGLAIKLAYGHGA